MKKPKPLTEGLISKGGVNPLNVSDERQFRPGGSLPSMRVQVDGSVGDHTYGVYIFDQEVSVTFAGRGQVLFFFPESVLCFEDGIMMTEESPHPDILVERTELGGGITLTKIYRKSELAAEIYSE